jgi:hypothetical protein
MARISSTDPGEPNSASPRISCRIWATKFGAVIRNEVLAKVLCHNLVVVIHEMHELGINPGFTPVPSPEARILRFPTA